jgi:hypothetical protein
MVFNEQKAKYGYKIFTEGCEMMGDVDGYLKIKCDDSLYRFVTFEVKHPNERKTGAQLFGISEFIKEDVPLVECVMDVDESKLIDGKITKDGNVKYETKTAWVNLDKCIVKRIVNCKFDPKPFLELPVGYFVREVKKGTFGTKTIFCKPVETLQQEIDFFESKFKGD